MELRVGISQAAIEQWGYQTVHGTNPVTYDLPIPFEEAPFTVAISTGNSGNHASCGGFTKTTIVLRAGTTAGVWDTVGFFIIGCQLQWGTSVSPIIFSISFSNTMYTILQMPQSASTSAFRAEVWALERKDQDSCAFFTGSGNYSRHWIAVGF